MKHLQDLATPVNKFANTTKLIGIFMMLGGGIALISYSSGQVEVWDLFRGTMLHLAIAGAICTFLGEMLWKILIKNSDVTKRQFYFYDEE
jgi:hypothetical protein